MSRFSVESQIVLVVDEFMLYCFWEVKCKQVFTTGI